MIIVAETLRNKTTVYGQRKELKWMEGRKKKEGGEERRNDGIKIDDGRNKREGGKEKKAEKTNK